MGTQKRLLDLENRVGTRAGSITVTLNNDQIKALPSVPFVLIEPTETIDYVGIPQRIFVPKFVYGVLDTRAGVYSTDDAAFVIGVGSDWSDDLSGEAASIGNLQAAVVSLIRFQLPELTFSDPDINNVNNIISASWLDNAIIVAIRHSTGNLTGGHEDNSLRMTVYYDEIDLSHL